MFLLEYFFHSFQSVMSVSKYTALRDFLQVGNFTFCHFQEVIHQQSIAFSFWKFLQVAYGKMKQDIANILSMLCKRKGVEIVEAEICPDHVHMLVKIPPSLSVSSFVGYLKGKSTLMIFERHANLKYKYGNRHFWCRGYYVDTVGKNAKKIQEYIQNQLQNDLEYDQMTLKEYIDPFTGEPVNQNK